MATGLETSVNMDQTQTMVFSDESLAGDLELTMRNQIVFETEPSNKQSNEQYQTEESKKKSMQWTPVGTDKEPLAGDLEMSLRSQIVFDRFQIPPPPWMKNDEDEEGTETVSTKDTDLSLNKDKPTEIMSEPNQTDHNGSQVKEDEGVIPQKNKLPPWLKPDIKSEAFMEKKNIYPEDVPVLSGSVKRLTQCFESASLGENTLKNVLNKYSKKKLSSEELSQKDDIEPEKGEDITHHGTDHMAAKSVTVEELSTEEHIKDHDDASQKSVQQDMEMTIDETYQKSHVNKEECTGDQSHPSQDLDEKTEDNLSESSEEFPELIETIRCVHVQKVADNNFWRALEQLEEQLKSEVLSVNQKSGEEDHLLEQLQEVCEARESVFTQEWCSSPSGAWNFNKKDEKNHPSVSDTEESVQDKYNQDLKKLNTDLVNQLLSVQNLDKDEINRLLAEHREQQKRHYDLLLNQKQKLDAKLKSKLQHRLNGKEEIPVVSSLESKSVSVDENPTSSPGLNGQQWRKGPMLIESDDEKELSFTAVEEQCVQVHISRAHTSNRYPRGKEHNSDQTSPLSALEQEEESNLFLISAPYLSDNLFQPSEKCPKVKHNVTPVCEKDDGTVVQDLDTSLNEVEDTVVHIGVEEVSGMAAQTEEELVAHAWNVLGENADVKYKDGYLHPGDVGETVKLPKSTIPRSTKPNMDSSSSSDDSLDSEEEELLQQYTQHLNETLDQESRVASSSGVCDTVQDSESSSSEDEEEDELAQTTLLRAELTSTLKNDIKENMQTLTLDNFQTLLASFRRDVDNPNAGTPQKDVIKDLPGHPLKDESNISTKTDDTTGNKQQQGKSSEEMEDLQATIKEAVDHGFNDIHNYDTGFTTTLKDGHQMNKEAFDDMLKHHLEKMDALKHLKDQSKADHERRIQERLQKRAQCSAGKNRSSSSSESSSEDEDEPSKIYTPDPDIVQALDMLKKKYLEDLSKKKEMLSKEELEKLLKQYREEQKSLIQHRQAERVRTNAKLKEKLAARQRRKREKQQQVLEKKKKEEEKKSKERQENQMSSNEDGTADDSAGISDMQKKIQEMDEAFYKELMSRQLRENISEEELEKLVEQHVNKVEAFRKRLERLVGAKRKQKYAESADSNSRKKHNAQTLESTAAAAENLMQLHRDRDEQARQLRQQERNRMDSKLMEKLAKKKKKKLGATIKKSPAI